MQKFYSFKTKSKYKVWSLKRVEIIYNTKHQRGHKSNVRAVIHFIISIKPQ